MNQTIGIFAHVDAGKTTLCEQILFQSHAIRKLGSVQNKNTVTDYHPIEQQRGITVFSAQGTFQTEHRTYYLVDTPGHADFVTEAERAMSVTDVALIVVSATDGVQAHTKTFWQLAKKQNLPVFFFINKCDSPIADLTRTETQLKEFFDEGCCDFSLPFHENTIENIALTDPELLECFLNGQFQPQTLTCAAQKAIASRKIFAVYHGSALTGEGVDTLLAGLDQFCPDTVSDAEKPLSFQIYKTTHDEKNTRLSFLKINSGTIKTKQAIHEDKINEIRIYNGNRYTCVPQATAGMLVAVTGLQHLQTGDRYPNAEQPSSVFTPPLMVEVFCANADSSTILRNLNLMQEEEPSLKVEYNEEKQQILIHVMGKIQIEILQKLMQDRFGMELTFGPPRILYKETPKGSAIGVGHYEPLRHYAEVVLRVEPAPRGSGILFEYQPGVNNTDSSRQNLIRTHVLEKTHRGTSLGAPLTDTKITLLAFKDHLKHTEGGDFRQATYRAIRQALRKGDTDILEPICTFQITVPNTLAGKILSDLQRMHAQCQPPQTLDSFCEITGTAFFREIMDYPQQLAAASRGTGSISIQPAGYDFCRDPQQVLAESDYDPDKDEKNPCGSVFCAKGAGYFVPWNEVDALSHCLKELE